jgi:hypothetical protein
MRCPRRQHANRDGMSFCLMCGSSCARPRLARDSQPRPGAAFCNHCGSSLTSQPRTTTSSIFTLDPRTLLSDTPRYSAARILTSRTALIQCQQVLCVLQAVTAETMAQAVWQARTGR